ncbi:hypothetical protein SAMN06298216_4204 [Spirosomataceae bacterium TFI 002]|nr:hypothetical protein SAMN06298216_4204 [Spirosomataceae bacterium TFI 002]
MAQPIFYFDKLKTWDKVTIALYVLLSAGLYYYFDNTTNTKTQRDILFGYAFSTQIFFYFFNYESLRNLSVYTFWVAIGFIHLYLYFQLKDNQALLNVRGHSATGLRNTLVLLLLFQVLRFISARTQGQELVCPSKSRTDLFDDRQITFIDFILFVIYIGSTLILLFYD